jgi:hypothetical protein
MVEVGLTDHAIWWQLKGGRLVEMLPGVYRLAGARRCWEQDLMALCLWGGPGTVASHRSAAALLGFDGFEPGPLEISTLKQNRTGVAFKVHRTEVAPAFITSKLGIPVTNAHRTLQDVVTVVNDERGNQLCDELLRKGLASMASLKRHVDREECSSRKGVDMLRRMVEQRSPEYQPSASEFQALVGRLLTGAGIPFIEEYDVYDAEGKFVGRADFKLLDCPVVVEAEGRRDHTSKIDFDADLRRRNRFTAAGLAMVHVTWDMARNHAEEFLDEVQRVRRRATSRVP